jgi:CRP-like cAMP-binding protein
VDNDVLRQAPLFSALDDEAATALRSSMAETKLRRGDVLFHEGDSGDKLYIVLDGKVKLGRTSSDGRENLLAILGPGQMFGELSLFDPGPRSATVTAVTDTTFASLSHEDLLRWLEGRPARPARRPAAQGQRRRGRPGLLRRPGPRGQGAARPGRPLRPHRR